MAKKLEDSWSDVPGFDSTKGEFIRLDPDRWLKENKIIEQARADGERNKPAVDEARSGIPDKITAWVNSRSRKCRQNVSKWLNDLERNLTDMEDNEGLEQKRQEVHETLEDAKLGLSDKIRRHRDRLVVQQKEVREANCDYEEFRRESRLRRLPDYKGRKFSLWLIFTFFFFELILNASMLMDSNPFGLFGAIIQMGLICAVNILIMGAFMGALLRLTRHVKPLISGLSVFLAIAIVLLVGGFNLVVGHFRDSMQAILNDPSADILAVGGDTFARFIEGYFALDSFQSALLALLGFLFFCVSSWKWLDRDDRYPGYGKKHRFLQEKQDGYKNIGKVAADELREDFEQYENKLRDVLHRLTTQKTRWFDHRVQGKQVITDYPTNMQQYQLDLNELLGAYYRANRAARSEPAPNWFSEIVELDKKLYDPPDFKVPEQTSLENVANDVHEAIRELQKYYDKHRTEIPTLEEAMANASIAGK